MFLDIWSSSKSPSTIVEDNSMNLRLVHLKVSKTLLIFLNPILRLFYLKYFIEGDIGIFGFAVLAIF